MKKFADDTDYKLELEPNKVKELLLKGHIKNDVYHIKPVEINDETVYTPYSPYNYSKYFHHSLVAIYNCSHFLVMDSFRKV